MPPKYRTKKNSHFAACSERTAVLLYLITNVPCSVLYAGKLLYLQCTTAAVVAAVYMFLGGGFRAAPVYFPLLSFSFYFFFFLYSFSFSTFQKQCCYFICVLSVFCLCFRLCYLFFFVRPYPPQKTAKVAESIPPNSKAPLLDFYPVRVKGSGKGDSLCRFPKLKT